MYILLNISVYISAKIDCVTHGDFYIHRCCVGGNHLLECAKEIVSLKSLEATLFSPDRQPLNDVVLQLCDWEVKEWIEPVQLAVPLAFLSPIGGPSEPAGQAVASPTPLLATNPSTTCVLPNKVHLPTFKVCILTPI